MLSRLVDFPDFESGSFCRAGKGIDRFSGYKTFSVRGLLDGYGKTQELAADVRKVGYEFALS